MEVFANPWAFWLFLAVPALVCMVLLARRLMQRALTRFGNQVMVRMLTVVRPGARGWQVVCVFAGTTLLLLGICGPQWGRDFENAQTSGSDLVVVLDMSRSMLAEKPSRQERARRALNDLCDALEKRGGHRVALAIFAARGGLVFPLTHDYNHLRAMLAELDADALPAAFRPDAAAGVVSGTRIGQGLQVALAAIAAAEADTNAALLLISDGDDPAQDDEWQLGIAAAVSRKIPVHTVSVGDPQQAYTIPFQGAPLQHQGKNVKSTVQEAPLEEIARATGGVFVPGRTDVIPLGKFLREVIEPRGQRRLLETQESEAMAGYRQRYAWFLAPALLLFATSMLIGERRRTWSRLPRGKRMLSPVSAAIVLVALMLLGSDTLPTGAALIREANAAFAKGQFEQACVLYDRAARITSDPGLIAFNKAAALYRLQRYPEAELNYRRCLQDQEAPAARQARCLYDLGNCLLQQEATRPHLEQAIACYRTCLQLADDAALRADAEHNLAAAKLRWAKLPADSKAPPSNGQNTKKEDEPPKADPKLDKKNGSNDEAKEMKDGVDPKQTVQKMAEGGKLLNLPDDDKLTPLSPANTQQLLEREMRRMLQGRRDTRQGGSSMAADVKDW